MSFAKKCSCSKHEEWCETANETFIVKSIKNRPFPKKVIDKLVEKGLLSVRCKYLCTVCAKYCADNFITCTTEPSRKRQKCDTGNEQYQTLISDIKEGNISEPVLIELAEAIGKSQKNKFRESASETTKSSRENINNFDYCASFNTTNIILLTFLTSITGFNINDKNRKNKARFALVAAIDCLISVVNCNSISPLFFALNLCAYFMSGSKSICSLLSSITPAGSYYSISSWFKGISEIPMHSKIPEHDLITYFDNSQVLSRNWRVRYQAKTLLSVITSVIHIIPSIYSKIQWNNSLSPRNWLYNDMKQLNLQNFIVTIESKFKPFRNNFICDMMKEVTEEIFSNSPYIDLDNPNEYHQQNPYDYIDSNHPNECPSVLVGEPSMVNPCSYEAVKQVLQNICNNTVSGGNRKWTLIGCDGLPYILCSRLIDKDPGLQNILIQPGLGHFEMNMCKGLFKLLWEVCLSDLARMLGYESIKAQTTCQNASDHHKSWQILTIFLYGTSKELLVPFVTHCKSEKIKPSIDLYYKWLDTIKDPCYMFLQEVCFTYTYALFLFRAAVRRNNSCVMLCARTKFSPLFYGLNQTTYQEINYRDLKMRASAPDDVINFLNENESFSVSGNTSKGEGGDFLLEAINRRLKMMMPPGLPTKERWLKLCRSYDELNKIRTHITEYCVEVKTDPNYMYHPNLEKEIFQWRKRLRSLQYLTQPTQYRQHTSMNGQTLDDDLINFSQHCKGNREQYMEDIEEGHEPGKGLRLTPIFVTPAEKGKFRNIKSKTKKEIEQLILTEISILKDLGFNEEANIINDTFNKKIKSGTKDMYISYFIKDVCVTSESCKSKEMETEDEDETEDAECCKRPQASF